jgi:hypothetical protein
VNTFQINEPPDIFWEAPVRVLNGVTQSRKIGFVLHQAWIESLDLLLNFCAILSKIFTFSVSSSIKWE